MDSNVVTENILFGMEKINQINRILLWEIAKTENLGPIQIQFIEFIAHQPLKTSTISELAMEFNLKKPTVSDSIRNLEEKGFILKKRSHLDSRVYHLGLTSQGEEKICRIKQTFFILREVVNSFSAQDKQIISQFFIRLIMEMQKKGIIQGFRICLNCQNLQIGNQADHANVWMCQLTKRCFSMNEMQLNCHHFLARNGKNVKKEVV